MAVPTLRHLPFSKKWLVHLICQFVICFTGAVIDTMRIYLLVSIAIFLAFTSEAVKSKKLKKFVSSHRATKGTFYHTALSLVIILCFADQQTFVVCPAHIYS